MRALPPSLQSGVEGGQEGKEQKHFLKADRSYARRSRETPGTADQAPRALLALVHSRIGQTGREAGGGGGGGGVRSGRVSLALTGCQSVQG